MQQLLEEIQQEEEFGCTTPVCGGNITTPVIDTTSYMSTEIFYKIGNQTYITNAD